MFTHPQRFLDGGPDGPYQVELAIDPADGMGWNYTLLSETDGVDTVDSETE